MDKEVLYPVCPHRNVPAAFARFHGPDSGGIERFFDDAHWRFLDGLAAIAPSLWLSTRLFGTRLTRAWSRWAVHRQLPLRLEAPSIPALHFWLLARGALLRVRRVATGFAELHGARLARALCDWTAPAQLPLLPSPRLVLALPV